ncbi:DoxX family protein [Planomonospora sp. ID82291]|uniref:DoxX family protein n=1 Tax=Planomonospora sp. ID82291 TaxID=2738136 RepID=UPI001A256A2C|nr:DoxX family protein [Planomonospora sp. ID82291]MBG0817443.1 DoxX family membrane protein [Planomonospora sp. ID82291]
MVPVSSDKIVPPRPHGLRAALPWVTTVSRLVLGGVLIVAGWGKIGAPVLSVQAVKAYDLLPESLATVVGYGLPIMEIVVGVLLVIGLLTRVAGIISALLMLAFVIGIGSAWARGLRIDCGCFGGGGQLAAGVEPGYLVDILRDFGLFALGVVIAWFPPGRFALDSVLGVTSAREADAYDTDDTDETEDADGAERAEGDTGEPLQKENH